MKYRRPRRTTAHSLVLGLLAAAAMTAAACDDPVRVDPHPEAEGVVILWGDVELLRYMHGDPTPSLDLEAGTTYDVVVIMLDDDGEPLRHDEDQDEEEEIVITIANTAVLTWTPEAEEDEHEVVEIHGELAALMAGATQMTICLLHGDHCDFEVTITVTVE